VAKPGQVCSERVTSALSLVSSSCLISASLRSARRRVPSFFTSFWSGNSSPLAPTELVDASLAPDTGLVNGAGAAEPGLGLLPEAVLAWPAKDEDDDDVDNGVPVLAPVTAPAVTAGVPLLLVLATEDINLQQRSRRRGQPD